LRGISRLNLTLKMEVKCSSETSIFFGTIQNTNMYKHTSICKLPTFRPTLYTYITNSRQEVLGRTNRLLSLIRHRPHSKRRVQQFFYCCVCIRYRGNVSTEPLPSNDREGHTDTHIHAHKHRQQHDLISLLLFFQNKESRLIKRDVAMVCVPFLISFREVPGLKSRTGDRLCRLRCFVVFPKPSRETSWIMHFIRIPLLYYSLF
jgi:hypothetical protein